MPGTQKTEKLTTFEEEVEYWAKEFPDLEKEDIADLLEAFELDKLVDDKYNYDTYSK